MGHMPLLIPQLTSCLCVPGAEDKDVLCRLLSLVAATEAGKNREDSGLEKKNVQAICFRYQLHSQ
jgi:hypothetical protein